MRDRNFGAAGATGLRSWMATAARDPIYLPGACFRRYLVGPGAQSVISSQVFR